MSDDVPTEGRIRRNTMSDQEAAHVADELVRRAAALSGETGNAGS